MELTAREQEFLEAIRRLPPAAAEELSALAQRLASLEGQAKIDWSDAWSDEDLADFTRDSAERIDHLDAKSP